MGRLDGRKAFDHLDKGDTFTVDMAVAEADAASFEGLVPPGGVANPDFLGRWVDEKVAAGRHEGQARSDGAEAPAS